MALLQIYDLREQMRCS